MEIIAICALILIVVVVNLAFFSQSSEDTIRIGVITPLTGPISYIGQDLKNGVILAQEEINSQGGIDGKKIEIRFEDGLSDPASAISAFRSLQNSFDPDVVIGSSSVRAITPIAQESGVPLLATVASASGIPAEGDYIFRFFTNADTDAKALAEYALSREDLGNFAILYVNDEFGTSYENVFRETLKSSGKEVVISESISYVDVDYATQLTKIKSRDPDALYIIGIESQIVSVLDQMDQLDMLYDMELFSVGTIATVKGVEATEEKGVEIYTTTFCTLGIPEDYIGKFMSKYSEFPGFFSLFGYDSINLIAEAAETSGSGKEGIREGLSEIRGFESVVGGEVNARSDGEMIFDTCPRKVSSEGVLDITSGEYYNLG